MLHFAAARTHTNNALFQLLQETNVSIGYRDELYRTARDISIQANVLENTGEIDRFVLHLAARGKTLSLIFLSSFLTTIKNLRSLLLMRLPLRRIRKTFRLCFQNLSDHKIH